ncbi:MAG: glycine betaine/L-proline ABC transporter ATP-binding protein [Hydrogenophaga sp.]|uniref:quaternary amine ABC transporter ATP-binding protein n=1 Tax=Hydrogenophaga sp. TaxID=1904254 RepID=UPI002717A440|nr:glycine betaine/L-proline ABC transporter ATP-binding protein [Hydrogenophaga sp.]MDO9569489.1 glycine betaine/L-proline ABC transporter ATP-binding protein [Hydrogenophaga sp.]MDP1892979.1 glycine betaine/L-proline ABC transporter ATP-binding protein [Hydrogenophaga sp.]MDP2095357.1 glycine betaine/L-proline ABC transporter ATP-binding protein [Hydrogenophaga sp.]MDP3345224.1 glycine betaine/L-proline ABC transporter ATP-binding protein [Hydrogenophaga sp.]MDP3376010.1 glycine betaine/L-pr
MVDSLQTAAPSANPQATPTGISIRHLYKIFGPTPDKFLEAVQQGMSKQELRDTHGHVLGLRDINIDMPAGGIQVVMGLSGSGKSTLIRHINRLIDPTSGELRVPVDGREVDVVKMNQRELLRFRREQTAMVFQNFALFPHYTVLENAEYGLQVQGIKQKKRRESALRWIERVGLKGYEDSYPNQLSGGMQQRVGLARALTNDAPILLMDEAFSALDPLIRSDMQSVLLDLQQEIGKTVVFITHDLDEALRLGDRIAILRDGEAVQQGTGQQIVLKPANDYIASFVRDVNRGRVIRSRTLMVPGARVDGPDVDPSLVIEEVARLLSADNKEVANVVTSKGRHLGTLSMGDIIGAIVPPNPEAVSAPSV